MNPNSSIMITKEEAANGYFCFLGEFGYEMISWIPYLLFLKEKIGLRLRTISRPGSSVFYYFSDEHYEVPTNLIGDVWGSPESYAMLCKLIPGKLLIYPGTGVINNKSISIDGYEWKTKDIHSTISEENYIKPDFSGIRVNHPFNFGRPYVVLNNKYFLQWPGKFTNPVNFFSSEDLINLRNFLYSCGYAVVYNHYIEETASDTYFNLADRNIFGKDSLSYSMSRIYSETNDVAMRNKLQLSVYNNSAFVIGPQGGNLYLPAICGKKLYILMRHGDFTDYYELSRLYGTVSEIFYEARHIIAYLSFIINKKENEFINIDLNDNNSFRKINQTIEKINTIRDKIKK